MSQLKGETITLKEQGGAVKIQWKQGSFLGVGGDRTQTYRLCTYALSSGSEIPVYIQTNYSVPDEMDIDSKLQYGMQEGVIFYVYHDKEQKPFQHRFRSNALQKFAYMANAITKLKGIDLSWVAGDYLHDV